jgi:hypothetical protein
MAVTSAAFAPGQFTSTWEITAAGALVIKHVVKSTGSVRRLTRYVPIKLAGNQLWFFAHDVRQPSQATFVGYAEDTTAP